MARVSLKTLLDRSNRNMSSGTHPVVRESALEMIRRAYKEGINVQISEGNRSNTRQNELYAQGRSKPGNVVTNARAGQSWHNYGVAVDFFLTNHSGSTATWTVNSNWRRVAQIGKSLGFEWGGDWTSFKDYPHLQMTGGLSLSDLQNGKKPKLTSKVSGNTPKPSKPKNKPTTSSKSTSNSIVDYLNSKGQDSSFANRKKLAAKHGISNYKGTASQNVALLNKLKGGKPASKPSKSVKQMASEVKKGLHGNGHAKRRKSLGVSNAKYQEVRNYINKGGSTSTKKPVSQMAQEIIDGKHGSGHANRRKSLGISNAEYQKVRSLVNKRM